MASNTCDIDSSVHQAFKEFRFRKDKDKTAALILKIDAEKLLIVVDNLLENTSFDALVEELPENSPRYLLLSYELVHEDGRKSNPLVGIFYTPKGSSLNAKMLYASAKVQLFDAADIRGKIFEIQDLEEFTEEWLIEQVSNSKTRK